MSEKSEVLIQARRLHALGWAVHWLHPKSKRPIGNGWTTGPRKSWTELARTYREENNLGVRLGTPSKLTNGFLAAIDVDVKGEDPRHREEALAAAKKLLGKESPPMVASGRGGGSRHYYFTTPNPVLPSKAAASPEMVRVLMPSARTPSKRDRTKLTEEELAKGYRIRPAWEVAILGDGQQVVLPPSIHPDSGRPYLWKRSVVEWVSLPTLTIGSASGSLGDEKEEPHAILQDFKVETVELDWLPISDAVREGILKGTGVSDRSAFLLRASSALFSAGLSQNEVLSVLTDPKTFLGACGYEHAMTQSRKRAAEWVHRYTVRKVVAERSQGDSVFKTAVRPPRKLSKEEEEKTAAEFSEDRDWRQDIIKTQQGQPSKLLQNVVHILSNAVGPNVIRRDEFASRDSYGCDTPWKAKKNENITDDHVAAIKYWMGSEFLFEPASTLIYDALVVLARQNAYDPVRDFLDDLPLWDGVPRLDSWLAENFGATGDPEYLAQVFRKWMVAIVMRVYRPGAKFDWMPIFEGDQGVGKSSFGRLLVGDQYFLDQLPNLNDKDAALALRGMWGVELGELSQFKKNELESIKAFVTRTTDNVRPPYGRREITLKRRCVFFGTTNRKNYLIDETGNRRFKPVVVGNLNFEALKRDRIQLFAEARHLYISKMETELSLDLTDAAREFELKTHQEKMVEDDSNSMEESMRIFIQKVEKGEVKFDLEKFRITELFTGVGPLGFWKNENRNHQFAAKMLRKLGAKLRLVKGLRTWKLEKIEEKEQKDRF